MRDVWESRVEFLKNSTAEEIRNDKTASNWVIAQRRRYFNYQLSDEQIAELESIDWWSWDPLGEQWEEIYLEILAYVKEHKELPTKPFEISSGIDLYAWINRQRVAKKKGILSEQKIMKLEAIEGFNWERTGSYFKKYYAMLVEYLRCNRRLPTLDTLYNDDLALWVDVMKLSYPDDLKAREIALLEDIPEWNWDAPVDSFMRFKTLANIIMDDTTIIRSISYHTKWLKEQRELYRSGKMDSERTAWINEQFDHPFDDKDWDQMCSLLQECVRKTAKHPSVHFIYYKGVNVGGWLALQRRMLLHGALPDDKVNKLYQVPGFVGKVDVAYDWYAMYAKLVAFHKEFGRLPAVRENHPDTKILRKWISWNKHKFRAEKLPLDKSMKLASISSWVW